MTEKVWLSETGRNQWMVTTLRDRHVPKTKSGRRKLRLFACACCRIVWDQLPDDRFRDAVEIAEAFADGSKSKAQLQAANDRVADAEDIFASVSLPTGVRMAAELALELTHAQAYEAAFMMTATGQPLAGRIDTAAADALLCDLLRDIFGNPFRPVKFDPKWRTEHTTGLATKMYDDRDFRAMPILADALEEAGCDNADILTHCREPGVHVRGCWVVDLVLGKA